MQLSYLQQLTIRLAAGMEHVAPEFRNVHAEFLKRAQRPDGGFGGRMGESDLYYTSFGLRSLAILGELYGEIAERAQRFLQSRLQPREKLIDHMSLVYGAALLDASAGLDVYGSVGEAWKDQFAARIEQLRRADGGFAKGPDGVASSTYYTFLSLLCLQLIERPVGDATRLIAFLRSQRDELGGFREIRVSKRAGTNSTAAGIGALRILEALDDKTRDEAAEFLADMQDDEGGLLTNVRIPLADLLSTFTGVVTLADLNRLDSIEVGQTLRFVRSLASRDGGFLAAHWDEVCDVEYTFYGLGTMSLLAPAAE